MKIYLGNILTSKEVNSILEIISNIESIHYFKDVRELLDISPKLLTATADKFLQIKNEQLFFDEWEFFENQTYLNSEERNFILRGLEIITSKYSEDDLETYIGSNKIEIQRLLEKIQNIESI